MKKLNVLKLTIRLDAAAIEALVVFTTLSKSARSPSTSPVFTRRSSRVCGMSLRCNFATCDEYITDTEKKTPAKQAVTMPTGQQQERASS